MLTVCCWPKNFYAIIRMHIFWVHAIFIYTVDFFLNLVLMKLIIISKFQARITAAVQTNVLFSDTLIFFSPFSIDVIAWDDVYKKNFGCFSGHSFLLFHQNIFMITTASLFCSLCVFTLLPNFFFQKPSKITYMSARKLKLREIWNCPR
jgi:hypothetical protein